MVTTTHYKHDGSEPVRTSTYTRGVAELREVGQERPFTFRENILARVEAYERGDKTLFNTWLDSCTSVVNKKRTTKLKVIPVCKELIAIPEDFTGNFLRVIYDGVPVRELDSSNGNYNRLLGENEIEDHEGWREALENDMTLLRAYRDIIFKGFKKERAMEFGVRQNTTQDELRALFVYDLSDDSIASGDDILDLSGSFLRGSPVVSAAGASRENTDSPYRKAAKTAEQVLDEKIHKELSRFDGFAGTYSQENYAKIKQEVAQNLKGLYKR